MIIKSAPKSNYPYKLDTSKIKTLQDVINVLEAFNVRVSGEGSEYFKLQDYLEYDP